MNENLYPNEAHVTDADRAALIDAILHAYPDFNFLYLRLENKWGFRPRNYFNMDRGYFLIAQDLVDLAASEGKVLDLLGVAWTDKPLNPKLRTLADRLLTDPAGVVAKFAPPPVTATTDGPSLEKLVEKRSELLNLADFQKGIERLSGALCRISLKLATEFEVMGTGFLIGRRHVLTNYHVMQRAIEDKLDAARVRLEFDYRGDGPAATSLQVAPGLTWDVEHRTYSQSDLTGIGEPAPEELDFALVRLAAAAPVERLHLTLPSAPPIVSQRDFIVIGQHPQGDAANIAFGEVLAYPGWGVRYRYDVTTEPGSSGSPVMTLNQKLVALHHAADPDKKPKYNQGVPIWLIMDALKAKNIDLGAL